MDGYDTLKLSADGTCQFTFVNRDWPRGPDNYWKRTAFVADPQAVADLRYLLDDIGYWRFSKAYHADVQYGTQWFVKVTASGRRKGVYCNNHFPQGIVWLAEFVHARILGPHRTAIDNAATVGLKPEDLEPEF